MVDSSGAIQVLKSPGVNVVISGATVDNSVTQEDPNCVGGVRNACAPQSTVENNLRGAMIDNKQFNY